MADPRTVRFVLRLRPSEKKHLDGLAKGRGLFLADFIRHRLLEWDLPRPTRTEVEAEFYSVFSKISVALRNAGNNLNQLAKLHQLGLPVDPEALALTMKETQAEVDKIRRSLAWLQ